MRVLILNYEYPLLGDGAGVATESLARGLASKGVAVHVVTAGEQSTSESFLVWDGSSPEEGTLTVHRVEARRGGVHRSGMAEALRYLVAALRLVRRLMRSEHYDVIHFFCSLPTGALLPFLNLGDTPVVVSIRGLDVPGYDTYHQPLVLGHRLFLPLTRWIWRRADRVVAVCESLGGLARNTLPTLKYVVVPNGVDLALYRPPSTRRLPRSDRVRCLAVTRLVERKGLADLIHAMSLLPRDRFELEIVGSGPAEQSLRELVAKLGLADSVTLSGTLDRPATAHRYREADLFTLASREEAFGNVFAEALASGLPVVGSTVGGIPELVHHGQNGLLVPPRNPRALAAAIRHLADDPALRLQMSLRNRAQAESTLSWEHATSRYLAVYHGVQRRAPVRTVLAELPSSSW
jgi:glycosyltransferase involved in cell wall biosynthesis